MFMNMLLQDTFQHPMDPDGMARLAQRMRRKQHFVVGVIGSSVAAGHDNCATDSYENQLETLLKPVFEHYGKTIEVRNAGEGGLCGDSYRNQIWCLDNITVNMVGDDVDAVHYSWTYFEGHDATEYHEMFVRWALMMPNAPIPFIMDTGLGNLNDDPHDDFFERYKAFGFNTLYLQRGLHKSLGYTKTKASWGKVGDGLHDKTRAGADGVVFRNWHPGPLGFQVVSDAIARVYLLALRDAVSSKTMSIVSPPPLPPPQWCDASWCGQHRPMCINFEEPTYGSSRIQVVDSKTDTEFPYASLGTETWTYVVPPNEHKTGPGPRRPECEHRDHCSGYVSVKGTAISFRIPPMKVGTIWVCCGDGKTCGGSMKKHHYVYEGDLLDTHAMTGQWGKCLQILDRHGESTIPTYLAIQAIEEAHTKLSHVIAL